MDIEFKEEPLDIKLEPDETLLFATDDYYESAETRSIQYKEEDNPSIYVFQGSQDNSSLDLNLQSIAFVGPIWICQICGCQIDNQIAFNDHMLSIHGFLVIRNNCTDQNILTAGCGTYTNIFQKEQYFCDECMLPLENKREFKNHMLLCHRIVCTEETNGNITCVPLGKSNAKYIHECEICHTHFYGTMNLYNHIEDVHASEPNNTPRLFRKRNRIRYCKLCGKRYYNFMNLSEHIKIIHISKIGCTNKTYQCNICHSSFVSYQICFVHFLNSHNLKTTLKCDICHNIFDTFDLLEAHEHYHHFKCNICKKPCKTLNAFKMHKVLHISTNPFHCYICERKYRTISELRKHIIRHNGDCFNVNFSKKKLLVNKNLKTQRISRIRTSKQI